MHQLTLAPVHSVRGQIDLPGSKSLSNRLLLLAAWAQGQTTLHNLLWGDDVEHMLNALQQLGVSLQWDRQQSVCRVEGLGGPFRGPDATLFLGNAGTAMRSLTAALCLSADKSHHYCLTGEPRMTQRPIADLVDALRALGAAIDYVDSPGYPPLRIRAQPLQGGVVSISGAISSQFLTALLLLAPLLRSDTQINVTGELVSIPYIDNTLAMMRRFGVSLTHQQYRCFQIAGQQQYRTPGEVRIEGDASSASYFLAAAAIAGGPVRVNGVGHQSVQGDAQFAQVLQQMGAQVSGSDHWIEVSRGSPLRCIDIDLNDMPDAAMTLATTALFAQGPSVIRNIYNWRVKETDRLAAMATELRKVGAEVEEGRDYLAITPPAVLQHACIDTYNDHRMAMCFSLLALSPQGITLNDPGCVSKTYPDYFQQFARICQEVA